MFLFFKSGPFHFVCLLKWQKYAKRCDKNDKGLTDEVALYTSACSPV